MQTNMADSIDFENVFQWSDGSEVDFPSSERSSTSPWAEGEPNDKDGEGALTQ